MRLRRTQTVLSIFAVLVAAGVDGAENAVMLPNGELVAVPPLELGYFDESFENACSLFGKTLVGSECHCETGVLWSVAEYLSKVQPVATNYFIQESLEAIRKDEQLEREGKIPTSPVVLGRRKTPNCAEVARRHRQIEEWNFAVIKGRRRLLTVASGPLKSYIGKLCVLDRRRYVESFVKKAKLNFDEKNIILKLCDVKDEQKRQEAAECTCVDKSVDRAKKWQLQMSDTGASPHTRKRGSDEK